MDNTYKPLREGDQISGVVVTIFAATRNEDTNEGRGQRIDHSYHKTHRSALIACKGIDVMGSDGQVETKLAIKLGENRYFLLRNGDKPIVMIDNEQEVQAAAQLRKKALGKLSPAERAALGL